MIIAFTKDWDDVPTSTTHVLREMAKTVPVLWVGSIGTRKPSAGSAKDMRRLLRRVWRGFGAAEHKENRLYVLHPLLIPKAGTRWAQALNRFLFRWYVGRFGRLALPSEDVGTSIEYWCFVPNAVDLLPGLEEAQGRGDKVVYYVADDWTAFHNLDGCWMKAKEDALVQRADHIFASSKFLVEKLRRIRSAVRGDDGGVVVYMPHGVDHALFVRALDRSVGVPSALQELGHPVIGFYGNLHPWVDFVLIAELAVARPAWSFVLIGEDYAAPDSLTVLANVHLLGRREHHELVDYCRGFDAAMIPYDMEQKRMESVNPVKTKELLSAGVPVVASAVPALAGYGDDVIVCRGLDAWLAGLDRQVAKDAAERAAISARMRGETWEHKVREIRARVVGS